MNDDIISLPNGDFQVKRKNSIREYLEDKFRNIRPLSSIDIDQMFTLVSGAGSTIRVGDKISSVIIQTPGSNVEPNLTPDWPGYTRRITMLLEREIIQYDTDYVLTPDSNFSQSRITIERK